MPVTKRLVRGASLSRQQIEDVAEALGSVDVTLGDLIAIAEELADGDVDAVTLSELIPHLASGRGEVSLRRSTPTRLSHRDGAAADQPRERKGFGAFLASRMPKSGGATEATNQGRKGLAGKLRFPE